MRVALFFFLLGVSGTCPIGPCVSCVSCAEPSYARRMLLLMVPRASPSIPLPFALQFSCPLCRCDELVPSVSGRHEKLTPRVERAAVSLNVGKLFPRFFFLPVGTYCRRSAGHFLRRTTEKVTTTRRALGACGICYHSFLAGFASIESINKYSVSTSG